MARPGIEPRTPDLRVRCPTDCATRPGHSTFRTVTEIVVGISGFRVLKVGSCPNDDNFVQIFFCPFLYSNLIILFAECVPAKKTARFCWEFTFYSFVYFLSVGILILKIVLSHTHK